MNLKLELEFSKADAFKQVDALKKKIDDMRPLPPDIEGRVMQKLRLDWNYNSNAIEGNKLSYGETTALLMHGITAKGKPLKDHLDIQGHNQAIDFLLTMVQDERPLNEADIRGLHKVILGEPHKAPAQTADGTPTTKMITVGEYKTSPNHVQTITGTIHYYALPEETPAKMQELMDWYNEATNNPEIHPIVTAALFHHRFVAIHPFDDGNGRMSRILINLILMRSGYPVAVIKSDNKEEYYALLSRADVGELWPFVEYIIERVERSLQLYIKVIDGGDIDEAEDIDKEIALFRMELKSKVVPKKKVTAEEINHVLLNNIFPFFDRLVSKLTVFTEFFDVVTMYCEPTPSIWSGHGYYNIMQHNEIKIYENIREQISSGVKILSIYVTISLSLFKNPDNVFNVSHNLSIDFEEQEYSITDVNDVEVYKFYNENISLTDQDKVLKSIIKGLKDSINDNFK
ncbi:Fic family protein [Mucilaginibacter terrae]|uniref:Fic family protein n=1 Tax=Mucilaginibacter terrae TaxID=1955052 RepID=UPI00362D96EC